MHLEHANPLSNAEPNRYLTFISVDYAPFKVGDKTFWLPAIVMARAVFNKHPKKWVSRYSDYHLYTASAKILPGTPEGATPQEPAP
jgi:hypothetical protein